MKIQDVQFVVLPGWQDSDEQHWQTKFEKELGAIRIQQENWMHPKKEDWLQNITIEVQKLKRPGVFIAHSLGCTTAVQWGAENSTNIAGAFLVAPPDIDREGVPEEIVNFRPEGTKALKFPSLVVSSGSDPWADLDRVKAMSETWGSQFIQSEATGHINPDAGFGEWPEGMRLLQEFVGSL